MAVNNPMSADAWRARIARCKKDRRDLIVQWEESVARRRGKCFPTESDHDRVPINLDAPYTRAKHAALFSQQPDVVPTSDRDDLKPILGSYAKRLNDELKKAGVGAAIDESVIDVINTAGIGAVLVHYDERRDTIDVPAVDPVTAQLLQAAGQEVPTVKTERVTDRQFSTTHVLPDELLWDTAWTGSDWEQAPWLGRSGRMFWAEAQAQFGLKDEDYDRVCGADRRDRIRDNADGHSQIDEGVVEYDEIFVRLAKYDASVKYFGHVQRLVFVGGMDDPIVDEPAKHQQLDPHTGQWIGSCRFPIQVLTFEYFPDDAIPQSDSAVMRPQVHELIEHRTNMILQRKRSLPTTWHDVNRVDPLTSANLMRGEWQASIPVKGNGEAVIGSVRQTPIPADDYRAAEIALRDAQVAFGLGPNQVGAPAGDQTAREAVIVSQNSGSLIGYQRARTAAFLVGIAELFSGLLILYGDLPYAAQLAGEFTLTVRPDSTVLLDAQQRTGQLLNVVNKFANHPAVDVTPIIEEILLLNNLDPSKIMRHPQGRVDPANLSYRFNGADLLNPLALAMLMKAGQAPSPQELEAAKQAILAAGQAPSPPQLVTPQPQMPPMPARIGPGLDPIVKRGDE